MFERFTDRARRTLVLAQHEAAEARHGFIGTEHVLLGLALAEDGLAARVLGNHGITGDVLRTKVIAAADQFLVGNDLGIDDSIALAAIGIDIEQVKATVEATFGEGSLGADPARPPFTPKSKHALEQSLREAIFLRHNFIGTEHLLIGFLMEPEGLARTIVEDFGTDPDRLIDETRRLAAPDLFRAFDLSDKIVRFQIEHQADDDPAIRTTLADLSQGRAAAMQRETDALRAASVALADELAELLANAEAALPPM
jgi:ATP-dependent Clp protease ATP-binding subunit ClpA